MANNNNGRQTPRNQPIPSKTPNAPRRPPRRTPTPNRNNMNIDAAFETPPRPVRRTPPRNTPRAVARRLNFNNANFMRFINEVLLNTPAPRTPAQRTPKRSKKNSKKK